MLPNLASLTYDLPFAYSNSSFITAWTEERGYGTKGLTAFPKRRQEGGLVTHILLLRSFKKIGENAMGKTCGQHLSLDKVMII